MGNTTEIKRFLIDILARVSQVIFTLLVVTPFITNIFNGTLFIFGILLFLLTILGGAIIAAKIEREDEL
jgi:hypothetical protein